MERLTTRTLHKAIEFASKHEYTSIVIIMDIQSSCEALRRSIMMDYDNLDSTTTGFITFQNGSYIRILSCNVSQNVRGVRGNIILIHNLVDMSVAEQIFSRMENSHHGHPGKIYTYVKGLEEYCELEIYDVSFSMPNIGYSVRDFGDLEPSSEILEYIGGLRG